jgi:hypothetical protein
MPRSLIVFAAALVLAIAGLAALQTRKIDAETLALGPQNQATFETWNGQRITGARISAIEALFLETAAKKRPDQKVLLWLGNSQLHAINQYKPGDHLAPYWMAEAANCDKCLIPLGVSLPNANLQEHLALTLIAVKEAKPDMVMVNLVFDDLREDGLRSDFDPLLESGLTERLLASAVGEEIMGARSGAHGEVHKGGEAKSGLPEKEVLQGFAQAHVEGWLDTSIGAVFPTWAGRATLRNIIFNDLYELRNLVFGIKPNTVRRVIPARAAKNMAALEQIAVELKAAGVPLKAYIAPIRNDVQLPYPPEDYAKWKEDVQRLAAQHGFSVVNLENLVPNPVWGSIKGDDVDFMHFQGPGHKLVAEALTPIVMETLSVGGSAKP